MAVRQIMGWLPIVEDFIAVLDGMVERRKGMAAEEYVESEDGLDLECWNRSFLRSKMRIRGALRCSIFRRLTEVSGRRLMLSVAE